MRKVHQHVVSELLKSVLEGNQLFGIQVSLFSHSSTVLYLHRQFLNLNDQSLVTLGEFVDLGSQLLILLAQSLDLGALALSRGRQPGPQSFELGVQVSNRRLRVREVDSYLLKLRSALQQLSLKSLELAPAFLKTFSQILVLLRQLRPLLVASIQVSLDGLEAYLQRVQLTLEGNQSLGIAVSLAFGLLNFLGFLVQAVLKS